GSGKSTLLKLLMGFYNPTEGGIRIDGVDMRDFDLASLRARIGLVAQEGNWPDLRDREMIDRPPQNGAEKFVVAWCDGAPGIGLARLQSLSYLGDETTRVEIDAALKTTLAKGFGGNHSLCHGALGNLELLLQGGVMLEDPGWLTQVSRLAAIILESMER